MAIAKRKTTSAVTAGVAAVILLGGTFAWMSISRGEIAVCVDFSSWRRGRISDPSDHFG